MICVSIGRGRHRYLIAEHKHLAEIGAKLVELRLDYVQSKVNLNRLLPERPCPVVITCRREADGGKWAHSEEQRQMLLRQAIVAGIEYVDLEEDIASKIPRFGKTKRIISYHNFRETPEDLAGLHARLAALDADVVKIATMVNHPHDNLRLLRLCRDSKIPTVAIGMGEIGTPSRVLAKRFGAPFTYATFHAERALAPGQLSFQQMKEIYRYEQINADTEFYGVVADPVAQSLSPLIHNAGFAHLKLNKVYLPFRVSSDQLPSFLADCAELGVKGLSVTIPHKEEILKHIKQADEATQRIGACNTVVFKPEGATGFNTDYRAAMACIDQAFGGDENNPALNGKTMLVLGAGGVSRALVYGLKRRAADVVIASRTDEKAEQLAAAFQARSVPWENRHTIRPLLVVNGTPVGMHPVVDETPFDTRHVTHEMTVFDTVYNPEQTLLIKQAREIGSHTITGIDMFVGQAALQFKLFTGQPAPLELMRQVVRRAISAAKT
ncbi:shikimate dehydrogenase [Anatilimnocola floriformis]|uniref:shikimate dehydrogenase n=1 Tax=Anatilimnocola floriformis TaxID=2948575 RepID=UPI0020C45F77|nr:shikimate dehydrogenase [Anatilimnocola floriformis]